MEDKVVVSGEGNFATVSVDLKIYSLNTVYSAAYVFLDKAYIILDGDPNSGIKVYLKPKNEEDAKKLGFEFWNELLNYAKYSANVKENHEITKMIIQKALFSADESLMQEMEDKEIEELIKELEKEGANDDVKNITGEKKDDEKGGK